MRLKKRAKRIKKNYDLLRNSVTGPVRFAENKGVYDLVATFLAGGGAAMSGRKWYTVITGTDSILFHFTEPIAVLKDNRTYLAVNRASLVSTSEAEGNVADILKDTFEKNKQRKIDAFAKENPQASPEEIKQKTKELEEWYEAEPVDVDDIVRLATPAYQVIASNQSEYQNTFYAFVGKHKNLAGFEQKLTNLIPDLIPRMRSASRRRFRYADDGAFEKYHKEVEQEVLRPEERINAILKKLNLTDSDHLPIDSDEKRILRRISKIPNIFFTGLSELLIKTGISSYYDLVLYSNQKGEKILAGVQDLQQAKTTVPERLHNYVDNIGTKINQAHNNLGKLSQTLGKDIQKIYDESRQPNLFTIAQVQGWEHVILQMLPESKDRRSLLKQDDQTFFQKMINGIANIENKVLTNFTHRSFLKEMKMLEQVDLGTAKRGSNQYQLYGREVAMYHKAMDTVVPKSVMSVINADMPEWAKFRKATNNYFSLTARHAGIPSPLGTERKIVSEKMGMRAFGQAISDTLKHVSNNYDTGEGGFGAVKGDIITFTGMVNAIKNEEITKKFATGNIWTASMSTESHASLTKIGLPIELPLGFTGYWAAETANKMSGNGQILRFTMDRGFMQMSLIPFTINILGQDMDAIMDIMRKGKVLYNRAGETIDALLTGVEMRSYLEAEGPASEMIRKLKKQQEENMSYLTITKNLQVHMLDTFGLGEYYKYESIAARGFTFGDLYVLKENIPPPLKGTLVDNAVDNAISAVKNYVKKLSDEHKAKLDQKLDDYIEKKEGAKYPVAEDYLLANPAHWKDAIIITFDLLVGDTQQFSNHTIYPLFLYKPGEMVKPRHQTFHDRMTPSEAYAMAYRDEGVDNTMNDQAIVLRKNLNGLKKMMDKIDDELQKRGYDFNLSEGTPESFPLSEETVNTNLVSILSTATERYISPPAITLGNTKATKDQAAQKDVDYVSMKDIMEDEKTDEYFADLEKIISLVDAMRKQNLQVKGLLAKIPSFASERYIKLLTGKIEQKINLVLRNAVKNALRDSTISIEQMAAEIERTGGGWSSLFKRKRKVEDESGKKTEETVDVTQMISSYEKTLEDFLIRMREEVIEQLNASITPENMNQGLESFYTLKESIRQKYNELSDILNKLSYKKNEFFDMLKKGRVLNWKKTDALKKKRKEIKELAQKEIDQGGVPKDVIEKYNK